MIAYLAEPMDFADGMDRNETNQLARTLASHGISVFRPSMAWLGPLSRPDHESLEVVRQNRAVLDRCGLVVAYLPSSVKSLGVPMEIAWATDQGKPVVVVTDHQHSTMLNGNPLTVVIDRPDMLMWAVGQARQQADRFSDRATRHRPLRVEVPSPRGDQHSLTFRQTDSGGGLSRAHAADAGYDLFTVADVDIQPGEYQFIPCGIEVALPPYTLGWIVARSSTVSKWGLIVTPGVIDAGFRGELGVPAYRLPGWPWPGKTSGEHAEGRTTIPRGTRLAQLVVLPNLARDLAVKATAGALPASPDGRGENGMGSTGVASEPVAAVD